MKRQRKKERKKDVKRPQKEKKIPRQKGFDFIIRICLNVRLADSEIEIDRYEKTKKERKKDVKRPQKEKKNPRQKGIDFIIRICLNVRLADSEIERFTITFYFFTINIIIIYSVMKFIN